MDEKERRKEVEEIVELVLNDYGQDRDIDKMDIFKQPDRVVVEDIVRKMMRVLFPGYYRDKEYKFYNAYNKLTVLLEDIMYNLTGQITMALAYDPDYQGADDRTLEEAARSISVEFFRQIPKIRDYIETDIQATFDGDPAAFNKEEIVLSYPGLKASTIYRVAHELEEATGLESRVTVLGYLQRGGTPVPYDRILATQFGVEAAHYLAEGKFGYLTALQNNRIVPVPLFDIAGQTKTIPQDNEMLLSGRELGICFGD